MIKLLRVIPYRAPKLNVDEEALDEFGRIAEAAVLKSIRDQVQADGSELKRNSAAWANKKEELGYPDADKSLVAAGRRLIMGKSRSFVATIDARKQTVTLRPSIAKYTEQRRILKTNKPHKGPPPYSPKELSELVQGKGYTGWFGMSEAGRAAMRNAIRKFLKRTIAKARSQTGG